MSKKITEQDILEVVDDFSRSIFEVGGVTPHAPQVTNDGIARVRVTNEFGAHVVIKFQAEYAGIWFDVDGTIGSPLRELVTDYVRQAIRKFAEKARKRGDVVCVNCVHYADNPVFLEYPEDVGVCILSGEDVRWDHRTCDKFAEAEAMARVAAEKGR